MKTLCLLPLAVLLLLTAGCGHSTFDKLVGNDRDEHGCVGSAGYTWSYALHDCVRLWEAGRRFDTGPQQVFLIFSPDSTYAEIFPSSGPSVLCKRVKSTNRWQRRKGQECVYIKNNVICIRTAHFTYTERH